MDELVITTRTLLAQKGIPGFLDLLLRLIDENLSIQIRQKCSQWYPTKCCQEPTYVSLDSPSRQIRTSGGTIHINWRRFRCRACGKTVIPLRE